MESPFNIQIVKETNNGVSIFGGSNEKESFGERYSHELQNKKHPKYDWYIGYYKLGKKRKKVIHQMKPNSGYSKRMIKEDGTNIDIGRLGNESQPKFE